MACAERGDSIGAMEAYAAVIEHADAPDDVKAMTLYNRALVFAAQGNVDQALGDLREVMEMPVPLRDIKLAAKRRLERLHNRFGAAAHTSRQSTS